MVPLKAALALADSEELVAFAGGGGKTSLMFALARELPRVVTTTTTRIFAAQIKLAPAVCSMAPADDDQPAQRRRGPGSGAAMDVSELSVLGENLARHGSCLVIGKVEGEKAFGVPEEMPAQLLARPDVDFVLVEADGSRMRPMKAPAGHEPVIPAEATVVVPVVGVDAAGGVLAQVAHRPEIVSELTGLGVEERVTAEAIASVLTHAMGGLKGVPPRARVIPFINKVETEEQAQVASTIALQVLREPRIERVLCGAVGARAMRDAGPVREVHRRVTGVVLAAGKGERMGSTKQLLPWGDRTVLGQTIHNVLQSEVHDVLVVTGHEADRVERVAEKYGAPTVHNPHYDEGEMLSSLQRAVAGLPEERAAVLVMLADQPMVEPQTINRILGAYRQGLGELVAPTYGGVRANPVIIGRRYFAELLQLPPGSAPREILRRHPEELNLVEVDSDSVLRDLDQPEQYEQLRP